MCPAVGQGALAIETRASGAARQSCVALDDAATHSAVTAERAFLRALGGGCQTPIGAHASINGARLRLAGLVIARDGSEVVRGEREGLAGEAENMGAALAADMLEQGARSILEAAGQ
jgi:hydroxymethylbilane synthase